MKILFLTSSLNAGGAERVATILCGAWADRGDEVILIPTYSGGGEPFYRVPEGIKFFNLADVSGVRGKGIFSYSRRLYALRRILLDEQPDVIVSFLPNVNVAAIVSSFFLTIPLVICERTDPVVLPPSRGWVLLCKLFYRYADALVVQTQSVLEKVNNLYPRLKRVESIPNPVSGEIEKISRKNSELDKTLLFFGRLSEEKQVAEAIEAFSRVASEVSDWSFHIYGAGPLEDELHDLVASLGMSDSIIFKGKTDTPWDIMSRASAFVMTSRAEGFPNSLLEAMAVGLPCVVYDCPSGPAEITRNGRDALLVPLNDQDALVSALRALMTNEALRESLGAQARESVMARYGLSSVLARWDALFRDIGALRQG